MSEQTLQGSVSVNAPQREHRTPSDDDDEKRNACWNGIEEQYGRRRLGNDQHDDDDDEHARYSRCDSYENGDRRTVERPYGGRTPFARSNGNAFFLTAGVEVVQVGDIAAQAGKALLACVYGNEHVLVRFCNPGDFAERRLPRAAEDGAISKHIAIDFESLHDSDEPDDQRDEGESVPEPQKARIPIAERYAVVRVRKYHERLEGKRCTEEHASVGARRFEGEPIEAFRRAFVLRSRFEPAENGADHKYENERLSGCGNEAFLHGANLSFGRWVMFDASPLSDCAQRARASRCREYRN